MHKSKRLEQNCGKRGRFQNPLIAGLVFVVAVVSAVGAEQKIGIRNPKRLGVNSLAAGQLPIGIAEDYKPCIAKLPDGELLLVGFHAPSKEDVRGEYIFLYRSTDDGRTWSARKRLDLLGREPYISAISDGTIFISTHVLPMARGNAEGYCYSYLYRSTDRGKSWTGTQIGYEAVPGAQRPGATPSEISVLTGRNVLELKDGTLVFGVGASYGAEYLWRSKDKGKSWDKAWAGKFHGVDQSKLPYSIHSEAFYWQALNGDILAVCRVAPRYFPPLPGTEIPQTDVDHYQRMLLYRSKDGGKNWSLEELGSNYGEMYPGIIRLKDGRLLFTFTLRAAVKPNVPPLGVQAVLGEETPDGFRFHFQHDRILLDTKTPVEESSGGGFGPTVQLGDGTLLTSYSYRTADKKTRCELVRWRLPR